MAKSGISDDRPTAVRPFGAYSSRTNAANFVYAGLIAVRMTSCTAARITEARIRQERHSRLEAETARHVRSLLGDIGKLGRVRQFVDRCIGDEHRSASAQHDGHPDGAMPGPRMSSPRSFKCSRTA